MMRINIKRHKLTIIKVMSIILYVFLTYPFDIFVQQYQNQRVSCILLSNIFLGSYDFKKVKITLAIIGIIPVFLFNLLFGSYIYKDIFTASEYIFSREKSRFLWMIKKISKLVLISSVYICIYDVLMFIIAMKNSIQKPDIIDFKLLISLWLMMDLFTIVTTLMINFLALCFGSNKSFLIVYLVLLMCSLISGSIENMNSVPKTIYFLNQFNPVNNVIIAWNYVSVKQISGYFYYIVLFILIILFFYRKISKLDIGINVREIDG